MHGYLLHCEPPPPEPRGTLSLFFHTLLAPGTLCCRISRCPTNAWVNLEISVSSVHMPFPSFAVLITYGCQISECWGEYERAYLEQCILPEHLPIHDLTWILTIALWSIYIEKVLLAELLNGLADGNKLSDLYHNDRQTPLRWRGRESTLTRSLGLSPGRTVTAARAEAWDYSRNAWTGGPA